MSLMIGAFLFSAAPDPPAPVTTGGPSNDPNEVVCVNETEIGSRVGRHRVCRTRAEWDEARRQARNSVERAQNERPTTCSPSPTQPC
jgi:hypothetical protein